MCCSSSFVTVLVQQRLQQSKLPTSMLHLMERDHLQSPDSQPVCWLVSIVAIVLWYGHLSIGNWPETAKLIRQKPMNKHQLKTISSYTPAIWTGLIRACVRLCEQKAMHRWQWWSTVFVLWKHVMQVTTDIQVMVWEGLAGQWLSPVEVPLIHPPLRVPSTSNLLYTLPSRSHLQLFHLICISHGKLQFQALHRYWVN